MTFYGLLGAIGQADTVDEVELILKKGKKELGYDDYRSLAEAAIMRSDTIRYESNLAEEPKTP